MRIPRIVCEFTNFESCELKKYKIKNLKIIMYENYLLEY